MQIRGHQFEALHEESERGFLLTILADFRLLFERVHGRAPRSSPDQQWAVITHVHELVGEAYLHAGDAVVYELAHRLLQAGERGVPSAVLREALGTFLACLPSSEAGFILVDSMLEPPGFAA